MNLAKKANSSLFIQQLIDFGNKIEENLHPFYSTIFDLLEDYHIYYDIISYIPYEYKQAYILANDSNRISFLCSINCGDS